MHGLLLSLLLLLQGVPIQPQQGGTVTGTLRDSAGKPVSDVRVTAVAVPESLTDAQSSTAMGAIAQTDTNGRYRLENIPPGRYYIAAGRLDLPTYYPGTQQMTGGTVVAVTSGSVSTQINFTMQDSSAGRSAPATFFGFTSITTSPSLPLPIEIRLEDGGKIPVFGPAGFITLALEPSSGGARTTLFPEVQTIQIPGPGPRDFRVAVENLPAGYSVQSMTYDGIALRSGALHLPATSFSLSSGVTLYAPLTTTPPAPTVHVVTPFPANPVQVAPLPPTPPLVIRLVRSTTARDGVLVRGTVTPPSRRSIYLSGKPGILFTDGTFEFRDVPPGRHSIITLDGSPLAASIVVGNSDLDGVQLQSTPVLPVGILEPVTPSPAGASTPGAFPLASLRVTARNRDTQDPLITGMSFLTGGAYGASRPLREDGTFEFSPLLPGTYRIEIMPFGFETVRREVVVGETSVDLKVDAAPAAP
jgi:Carboxypeptidase regulatory-like domain